MASVRITFPRLPADDVKGRVKDAGFKYTPVPVDSPAGPQPSGIAGHWDGDVEAVIRKALGLPDDADIQIYP